MATESGLKVTGFRITRTLDRLAYDLLRILRDMLSDPDVDLLHRRDDVDLLELRVLALLSQPPYVNHLLWRDYRRATTHRGYPFRTSQGEEWRIHDEAITYFYHVLRRRLGLAQNLKERPTNMHRLLQAGCRFGPAEQGWPEATIKRDRALRPRRSETAAYQRTVEALTRRRQEPRRDLAPSPALDAAANDDENGIVARRRAAFGPLWLVVADWAVEIDAELSLFHDVSRLLPAPLPAAFAEDAEWQQRLQLVLESLNKRYGLLRSCGLDPGAWWGVAALSVNVLDELKQLRRSAAARLKERPEEQRHLAYETCFNALKGDRTGWAGCKTFSEFLATEIGARLVVGVPRSIPPAAPAGAEDPADHDASGVADPVDPDSLEREPTSEEAERFIAGCPELARDALMSAVVRVAFAGRALDEPEILAELRRLIEENDLHRKQFGALTDRSLVKALCARAEQIVQRRQRRLVPQASA